MRAKVGETKERLVEAAERLFAERGIDGVSLNEIVRESGARNATALQYHFGDRTGLLRSVLERHHPDIDAQRHALLDRLDGRPDLRGLVEALVRPMAAKLADESGRAYLRIVAELTNRPEPKIDEKVFSDPADSMYRWRNLVAPLLDEQALRLHRRFVAFRFTVGELGRRAQTGPHTDDRLFVSHLVDLAASVLIAPLSGQTLELAAERDSVRPTMFGRGDSGRSGTMR